MVYWICRNGHISVWECNIDLSDLVPWTPALDEAKQEELEKPDDVDESHAERTDKEQEKLDKSKEVEIEEEFTTPTGVTLLSYKRASRHYLRDLMKEARGVTLVSAAYHKGTHILVTGFSNGAFFLHEMPDMNLIHSLRYLLFNLSLMVD
jgi:periodic tryptophan protein 2